MRFSFHRSWLPAALLLVASSASDALTLGRAQGVALIGRPLEVGIQLGLDGPADSGDLCTEAEVFYGETRVDARRVDLRSSTTGSTAAVRLRIAAPVDEAYVTVLLRVGCSQKLTRRYVLLSEQPADVVDAAMQPTPAAPPISAVGSGTAPAAAPPVAPPAAAAATAGSRSAPTPATLGEGNPAAPRPPAPRPVAKPAAAPPPPPVVARPRLKLDAVEIRPETAVALKSATVASQAARPDMAAPLQALSVPNEELQRNAERILSLEADLKALREGMLQRDSALTDLRTRLDQAERERYANSLVYGLAALLAAALGLIAVLWLRRSPPAAALAGAAGGSWWEDSRGAGNGPPTYPVGHDLRDGAAPAAAVASAEPAEPAPAQAVAADAKPAIPPLPMQELDNLSRSSEFGDFSSVRVSDPLPLTSDALSDIQQEADFFVSLGEFDRAIEVLRNHVDAHPQASPVAWLALLEIHHSLGRLEAYEQLRRDFEWLFSVHAPAFTSFAEDLRSLQDYPRLLARLQSVWPGPAALQVIDDALFRRSSNENDDTLTLQAYRDLLFLHDIASELAASERATAAASENGLDIDVEALERQAEIPMPPPLVIPARSAGDQPLEFDLSAEDAEYRLPGHRASGRPETPGA